MQRLMFVSVLVAAGLAGCRKRRVKIPGPPPRPELRPGEVERGIASWYGHPYHGRQAANGETYDMNQLTAAHLTLPFGTLVDGKHLDDGKTVQVRITDRGPFWEGRIIDLSREAARRIDLIGPGTAQVEVRIKSVPEDAPPVYTGDFAVQIGAFQDRDRATKLHKEFEKKYGFAQLVLRRGSPDLWRVLVGREPDLARAERLAATLRREFANAFVVRLDRGAAQLAR